jgi:hypothetical protein
MPASATRSPRLPLIATIAVCAALLILFAIVSYSAARTKSATYDESLHAVAGFVHLTTGDFRINPEHPALFGYWSALLHSRDELKLDLDSPFWTRMLQSMEPNQWPFAVQTLYRTPGNDADAFLNKSRFMFVILGVMLGALIAIWSWQLAGIAASIIATSLFAFDPNFLAHTALVTNDVMLSLVITALAFSLWRFGRRGTWTSLIAIALCCAAAVNVKFSGLLCGPIIFIALVLRALLPQTWSVIGWELTTLRRRMIVVPIVCVFVALVSFIAIWTCYGFRFAPTSDPNLLFDMQSVVLHAKQRKLQAQMGGSVQVTAEMADRQPLGAIDSTIVWAESKRLLPQAWVFGFLFTRGTTYVQSSYLLGQTSLTGWWYYFPCAMIFKTPIATLLAIPIAIVWTLSRKRQLNGRFDWWSIICVGVPPILYGAGAMAANLNLGLRHILPVYPFIFIAIALGLSWLMSNLPRAGGIIATLIVIGVASESLAAYPNYLAFFNTPSSAYGKINLLGDSNLDWGQDLKALAQWRAAHRDLPMYLAYFGMADPHYYNIDAFDVPPTAGGYLYASEARFPLRPCYFAISATNLQGIYIFDVAAGNFYRDLLKRNSLIAVLNDTIYIYQLKRPS